ncbi:hypothetical protein H4S06_004393, partial [Coemansia sp. BCRC 34490]
ELYKRGYEYAREWTGCWQKRGLLGQWQSETASPLHAGAASASDDRPSSAPAAYKLTRRNSF